MTSDDSNHTTDGRLPDSNGLIGARGRQLGKLKLARPEGEGVDDFGVMTKGADEFTGGFPDFDGSIGAGSGNEISLRAEGYSQNWRGMAGEENGRSVARGE